LVLEISQYFTVKDAVSRALAALGEPESETVATRKAFGRVAAETVVGQLDLPPFSTSHMDGFAIRADDSRGATQERPISLTPVGSVPLGTRPVRAIGKGEAVRLSTGSFLPEGADSVLPVEEGKVRSGRLRVSHEVPVGAFVFKAGEDISKGRIVAKKGEVLRAQDIGVLVALAIQRVRVWRRPTIGVLATGNELTNSMSTRTFKTRNSHAPIFLALGNAIGCNVIDFGIAPDSVNAILGKVKQGLRKADVLFMTGGTSVGRHDLGDQVMARLRPRVLCHGLRMDRGRVAGVAVVKGKGIVMMPGPVQGAMNAFVLLGLPMIAKISGMRSFGMTVNAKLTRSWEARKRFPNFTKVVYLRLFQSRGGTFAEPLAGETESISLLADSNAYAVIPEEVTRLEAGRTVDAQLLPGFSFGRS
jgi:molybdenum cofactor synthesis domain-containing protein